MPMSKDAKSNFIITQCVLGLIRFRSVSKFSFSNSINPFPPGVLGMGTSKLVPANKTSADWGLLTFDFNLVLWFLFLSQFNVFILDFVHSEIKSI